MSVRTHRGGWRRRGLQGLALLSILLIVQVFQTRHVARGTAPPLTGTLLSGDVLQWPPQTGQPRLVHFWASWCPVCEWEHGTVERIAGDYPVIGVAYDTASPAELRAYLQTRGIRYPVLVDADGSRARKYGVRAVPTSFVLDGDNRIRFVTVGYTTEWGLRARLWWAGWTD
jgi:thiol-disulfide isomerase/thioredoxin